MNTPPSLLRSGKPKVSHPQTSAKKKRNSRKKNNSCPDNFLEPRLTAYYSPTQKQQRTPTSNRFDLLELVMENEPNGERQQMQEANSDSTLVQGNKAPDSNLTQKSSGNGESNTLHGTSQLTPAPTATNDTSQTQSSVTFTASPSQERPPVPPPTTHQQGQSSVQRNTIHTASDMTGVQHASTPTLQPYQTMLNGQLVTIYPTNASQPMVTAVTTHPLQSNPAQLLQPGPAHLMQSVSAQPVGMTQGQPTGAATHGFSNGNSHQSAQLQTTGLDQQQYASMQGQINRQGMQNRGTPPNEPPSRALKRAYPGDSSLLEARFLAVEHNVAQGLITQNRAETDMHSNKIRICPCPFRTPTSQTEIRAWYKKKIADAMPVPPGMDLCPPGIVFAQVNLPSQKGPARENMKMIITAEFPTALQPNFLLSWRYGNEKGGIQICAEAHKNYDRVTKEDGDVNDHVKNGFCLEKDFSMRPQLTTRHNLCCKWIKDLIRAIVKVMQDRDDPKSPLYKIAGQPWMDKVQGKLPQLQQARQGQDLKIRVLVTPASNGNPAVYKNDFILYENLTKDTRTAQYALALGKQPTNVAGKLVDYKTQSECLEDAKVVLQHRQNQISPAHVPYIPAPPNHGYATAVEFTEEDPNIPGQFMQ